MRKRTGIRKPKNTGPGIIPRKPSFMSQRQWDDIPISQRKKVLENIKRTEGKSATMGNPADFMKGIVAAEGGFPMDVVSLMAPGGGMSHAQRLTQMQPGGHPGYKEQEFVPEYKGTTPDLYSKMGGDPTSGAGLLGELMAPGAIFAAPIAGIRGISKGIKFLGRGNKALNRVFGAGDPIFANQGMEETAQLLSDLKAEVNGAGNVFIARDKLIGMINSTNPEKRIYNKQIREYSGFDKWLNDYKNEHAKGKKRHTTISLNDLKKFWDENNLDIREIKSTRFADEYIPDGGTNGKMAIVTYHGKNPPMSIETSTNLDQLAQDMHQKSFDELNATDQEFLENIYPKHYPEDTSAQFFEVPDPSAMSVDSKIVPDPVVVERYPQKWRDEKSASHHGESNAIGHMRYDERPGIGEQAGEKHLSFHETQSDWAQRATREGVFDIGRYDEDIYKLQLENRNLTDQLKTMDHQAGRSPEGIKFAAIINDNHAEIKTLRAAKKKLIDKMGALNAAQKIPFIYPKDQEKWLRLMLKRKIKMGVDGGFDRVTFGSSELANQIGLSSLHNVHEVKIKKMSRGDKFEIKRKEFKEGGDYPVIEHGEPIGYKTVSGEEYPYLVEAYSKSGTKIEKEVNHYSESGLFATFGNDLAEKIINKAKLNTKTVITDLKDIEIGAENLKVLYDRTIPKILKEEFKDLDLELEIIPLGTHIDETGRSLQINQDVAAAANLVEDQVRIAFLDNEEVTRARGSLEDYGIVTTWHREPPYISFGTLNDAGEETNRWRGLEEFDQALTQGVVPFDSQLMARGGISMDPQSDELVSAVRGHAEAINNRVRPAGDYLDNTPGAIYNPASLLPEQRDLTDIRSRERLEYGNMDIMEGVDWENLDEHPPGIHDRLFMFNTPTPEIYIGTAESIPFNKQYRTSGEFKVDLDNAIEDGEISNLTREKLNGMYKAMKHIEIHGNIPSWAGVVDNQWVHLMDPNTRQMELSHIEEELRGMYGIRVIPDETGVEKPKFTLDEGGEPFTADEYFEGEILSLQDNAEGDNIIVDGRLYEMFHEDPKIFNAINLIKRYEIAGDPLLDAKEVLTKKNVEFMPIHINQYTVDYDGPVHPQHTQTGNLNLPEPGPGNPMIPWEPRPDPITPDIEWDQLHQTTEGLRQIRSLPEDIQGTLENLRHVSDRIKGSFDIQVHYPSHDMPPAYTVGSPAHPWQADLMSRDELLSHPMVWDLDEIEDLKEYLLDFEHYHDELAGQISLSNLFEETKSLVDTQPKVLSVKIKGNKKLEALKDKKFYYGALPPGILAGEAARQSLLDEDIW